jgi:hypothetical protein
MYLRKSCSRVPFAARSQEEEKCEKHPKMARETSRQELEEVLSSA